jgi:hypothetical protein
LLYDITFDQSFVNDEIMNNIKNYLTDYASKNQMFGSIVRVNIFVNEKTAQDIIHNEIISFLKKELLIYHCTGIHLQITAKRQLRKASITERLDPVSSFNEYLELEEDPTIRERMRELGVNIISKRLS